MKSGDVKSEIWGKSGDTILIYTDFCGYLPGFLCHESRTKNVLQVFHRIVITKEVASCFFVLEKHCKKAVLKFFYKLPQGRQHHLSDVNSLGGTATFAKNRYGVPGIRPVHFFRSIPFCRPQTRWSPLPVIVGNGQRVVYLSTLTLDRDLSI